MGPVLSRLTLFRKIARKLPPSVIERERVLKMSPSTKVFFSSALCDLLPYLTSLLGFGIGLVTEFRDTCDISRVRRVFLLTSLKLVTL